MGVYLVTVPTRHMRDLTKQTPVYAADSYGESSVTSYTASTVEGRVDQSSRQESREEGGRIPSVSMWLLIVNEDIEDDCRIVDGGKTYELDGPTWPVYGGSATIPHHYEATMRLVEG